MEILNLGQWQLAWLNKSSRTSCFSALMEKKVSGFAISNLENQTGLNDSLNEVLPKIRSLAIPDCKKLDISFLNRLTNLEFLSVGTNRNTKIDFSVYDRIQELSIDWLVGDRFPSKAENIKKLTLRKYNDIGQTIENLACFSGATELEIVHGNIISLSGIEAFQKLERAGFHYMRKLKSINNVASSSVKELTFEHCPKILDLDSVVNCKNLTKLLYNYCSPLTSVEFIGSINSLKEFRFSHVNVLDGNLKSLEKLHKIYFTNKKHFTHRINELGVFTRAQEVLD